jgi:hypothetical protein
VNAQDPPRLRAALLGFQYQIQSESGDIQLIPADQVDALLVKGGMLQAKVVETEMVFPLGVAIRVTKEDVKDLLFTCNNIGLDLVTKLVAWVRSLGFEVTVPDAGSPPNAPATGEGLEAATPVKEAAVGDPPSSVE